MPTNRKVTINVFDNNTWDEAFDALRMYQEWLNLCTEKFVRLMAQRGVEIAQVNFNNAIYAGVNDVQVQFTEKKLKNRYRATVIAEGEAVAFIEFGTGITQADNPMERSEVIKGNIVPHGWYGKGKGANPKGWIFNGSISGIAPPDTSYVRSGTYHTKGNPANSSLWNAKNQLEQEIAKCIKEAFQ